MPRRSAGLDYLRFSTPGGSISRDMIVAVDPSDHPCVSGLTVPVDRESTCRALYVSMRMKESMLAQKAFEAAMGRDDPYPHASRESILAMLTDDYSFFGLASGPKHAEELVRTFESQAAAQAKAQLGARIK